MAKKTTRIVNADQMREAADLASRVHPAVLATALGMALIERGLMGQAYALSQIAEDALNATPDENN